MKRATVTLPKIKLVGITAKTTNANEMEPSTAKIGSTVQAYMQNNVPSKILNRKQPNVNFCVYTDYESDYINNQSNDYLGSYTYFIGEEVESFADAMQDLKKITIPAQKYIKFTTAKGSMPQIVINAWMEIWQMSVADLGHERNFIADFEIYDERASNLADAEVDIFIGIKG